MRGRVSVPTGEFLPDIQERDNPGVLRTENVFPRISSYIPAKGLVADTGALNERARGGATLKGFSGLSNTYAGDRTELYTLQNGNWLTATGALAPGDDGPYVLQDEDIWQFIQFQDNVIASNGNDPLQIQLGLSGDFADIVPNVTNGGEVPTAKYITIVKNFIVTGNQSGNQNEVIWGGIGKYDVWEPTFELAGTQILQRGGVITGVAGPGEYGIVFCEHSIYRMNFQGAPFGFSFDEVAPGRGTSIPGSIAQYGRQIYYIDTDGFYVFDGADAKPIGSNKLNAHFAQDLDYANKHRVTSLVDFERNLVMWAYPGEGNIDGLPNKILSYDWTTGKWAGPIIGTTAQPLGVELLLYATADSPTLLDDFLTDNFPQYAPLIPCIDNCTGTLEDLDADYNGFGQVGYEISMEQVLVDSPSFLGGIPKVSAFDKDHKHATFVGPILPAVIESGEYSLNEGGRVTIMGLRPLVEGDAPNIAVKIGTRDQTHGPITWSQPVTPNPVTGRADFRIDARYHRFRIEVDGDYRHIFAGEAEFERSGYK